MCINLIMEKLILVFEYMSHHYQKDIKLLVFPSVVYLEEKTPNVI